MPAFVTALSLSNRTFFGLHNLKRSPRTLRSLLQTPRNRMPATEPTPATTEPATTEPATTKATATEPGKAEIAEKIEYPTLLFTVVARSAESAIKFYEKALNGTTKYLYRDNGGKIMHSVIQTPYGMCVSVNDYYESEHLVQPAEEGTGAKAARGTFNYVSIPKGKGTADECIERMREAGAEVVSDARDLFYGHRAGKVVDVYGVGWVFAHEIEMKDEKK